MSELVTIAEVLKQDITFFLAGEDAIDEVFLCSIPVDCAAGHNLQEIADFCRCKFTEPLTDEIYNLQVENKRLRDTMERCVDVMDEEPAKDLLKQAIEQK